MNRINDIGMNFIEYKKEYMKHHSEIIDNALILALQMLLDKKELDLETFELIKDDSVSIEDFKKYLLTRKEYTKSLKELFKEFEKIRLKLDNYLSEIDFVQNVSTETSVENSKIIILKQYSLDKNFIQLFFGVEEKDMIQLMKKRGFVEKYCVLRFNKIFKEIYNETPKEKHITQGYSLVYFNKEITGFSIDYKYLLNVDFIANEGNMRHLAQKIKELDLMVEEKFNEKSCINLYKDKLTSKKEPLVEEKSKDNNVQNKTLKVNIGEDEVPDKENQESKSQKLKDELIVEVVEDIKVENTVDEVEEIDKDEDESKVVKEEVNEKKEIPKKNKKQKPSVYRPLDQKENKEEDKQDLDVEEEKDDDIVDVIDVDIPEIDIDDENIEILDIGLPVINFDDINDDDLL